MSAIRREGPSQFRVSFAELARGGLLRRGRAEPVLVDPYAIGRAIAEVMRACTMRSAAGTSLLWNEYRVVMARADYELIGALAATLDRELAAVLSREVEERGAELAGELRVSIVVDEADELPASEAVVRVAFVPTERLAAPRAGEMTVRFPEMASSERAAYVLTWPHGRAVIEAGAPVIVGRPHPEPPARFIALEGASAKINKQHFVLTAKPASIVLARPARANPIHVGERALAPGETIELPPPITISLSKGDLRIVITQR